MNYGHSAGGAMYHDTGFAGLREDKAPRSSPERPLNVLPSALWEAVVQEILEYFSDGLATGVKLQPNQAHWIASGVLQRVCPYPSAGAAGAIEPIGLGKIITLDERV